MKALRIKEFGPLENLRIEEIEDPPLPSGSVRLEIEAAGVNPSDTGVALGRFPQATLPRTLGRDFAGRVIEGRGYEELALELGCSELAVRRHLSRGLRTLRLLVGSR